MEEKWRRNGGEMEEKWHQVAPERKRRQTVSECRHSASFSQLFGGFSYAGANGSQKTVPINAAIKKNK